MNLQYKLKRDFRMSPSGRRRYLCKVVDCANIAQTDHICVKHGFKQKRCSSNGCTNQAIKDGICIKHGIKRDRCKVKGCNNQAQSKGICCAHGHMHKKCSTNGCTKNARQKGKCIQHGATSPKCQIESCHNQVKIAGYCTIHHPEYVPIGRTSPGAQAVLEYFMYIKLPFETEKRYNKCRHKYPLPFDYYVPIYNLCIEYDGRQHTEPVKGWGGQQRFELQKKCDGIKNKFCKDNKINLLRIPYTTKIKDIPHLINKALHESCAT
jgi:hypothetical protein